MIWNIFKKDKQEDSEKKENQELEQRIEAALKKAEADKRNAEKGIVQIQQWAADAIIDTYADFFPNANYSYYRDQYKETALADYEKIKQEHSSKLDAETSEKCDKIVKGYLKQIELQQSKVKLYDKLYKEHLATKKKFDAIMNQAEKTDKLDSHSDRLKAMNDDTKTLADAYTGSYQVEDLNKELALKEEYYNQLDKLNQEYGDGANYDSASAYKNEVDKMIDQM